jgi:putative transposase
MGAPSLAQLHTVQHSTGPVSFGLPGHVVREPLTCADYQAYLASHAIACSMSRRADCYDNAVIESFFATVKKEEADRFPSYSDAKTALFDYIEVFYNQRRRHSALGQISPAAFERRAAA